MSVGKSKRVIFRECANALIERQNRGVCTPEQREKYLAGRDALTRIIIEVLAMPRGENNVTKLHARQAMREFDLETNYYFTDTIVREIANVCLTLRTLGERPKAERDAISLEQIVDAIGLCQAMQEVLPR